MALIALLAQAVRYRQAGRCLPSYRKLRERHGILEIANYGTRATPAVNFHRLTRAWEEGSATSSTGCDGQTTTWSEA